MAEAIQATDDIPDEAARRHPAALGPQPLSASADGDGTARALAAVLGPRGASVLGAAAVAGALLCFDALSLGAVGRTIGTALLVVVSAACAALLAWRLGRARGQADMAGPCREAQAAFAAERALLRAVTDSQPDAVMVFDAAGRCRFANRAARDAGEGQDVPRDGPPDAAPALDREGRCRLLNRAVLESGRARHRKLRVPDEAGGRHLRCEHRPVALGAGLEAGVLVVERDITAWVTERKRHRRNQAGLVETLLAVIDQRDPYAAHHAARVGDLAARMADRLGLEAPLREATRLAGTLITAGKPLVPEVMLTHDDRLCAAEREQAASSLEATVGLLAGLEFDVPVIETLRQVQERIDGRGGPCGLIGDRILPSARIVKVANSFLGLVSHRPGCPSMREADAIAVLRRQAGSAYDRRAVDALVLCLEGMVQRNPSRRVAGQPNRRQQG